MSVVVDAKGHTAADLLNRAAQVFVGIECGFGPEVGDRGDLANVGALHQHIHGGGIS